MSFDFKEAKHILIFGMGEIAKAITEHIQILNPNVKLYGVTRSKNRSIKNVKLFFHDPTDSSSWSRLEQEIGKLNITFDLIFSSYGVLHNDKLRPEKRLADIQLENMIEAHCINTFSCALIAKHFSQFLPIKKSSTLVFLSAKVGSIEDNKMGGWYSYRSSKAALNMMMKNISIELGRSRKLLSVQCIHPGTTKSALSKPFLSSTNLKVRSPLESAKNICNVIEEASRQGTGLFKNWDGSDLPW
tara:strand:- start:210936 stop:211667 length:732 start_codon:yes stop_codon:yes gene_type:complete